MFEEMWKKSKQISINVSSKFWNLYENFKEIWVIKFHLILSNIICVSLQKNLPYCKKTYENFITFQIMFEKQTTRNLRKTFGED